MQSLRSTPRLRLVAPVLAGLLAAVPLAAQDETGTVRPDPSKPVPARSEVIAAWRKRQDAVRTFRFAWTERQAHPKGWIPNPRFPEREWLSIPGLLHDRSYVVSKTLAVDGDRMRYAFEIDRAEEADGIRVKAQGNGPSDGLGLERNYRYLSVFDGQRGRVSLTSLMSSPPPTAHPTPANVDAQDLDTRPIMMALRPLDPVMGHLLLDRAVCNERRRFYRGRSVFLLEERHDPSGWKTMLWVEPERGFLVSRFDAYFEQKLIVAIDIDYEEDPRWGWIPSGWRVSEMLEDQSRRLICEAIVTRYDINQPIEASEFR
jgi:hypothetical protein